MGRAQRLPTGFSRRELGPVRRRGGSLPWLWGRPGSLPGLDDGPLASREMRGASRPGSRLWADLRRRGSLIVAPLDLVLAARVVDPTRYWRHWSMQQLVNTVNRDGPRRPAVVSRLLLCDFTGLSGCSAVDLRKPTCFGLGCAVGPWGALDRLRSGRAVVRSGHRSYDRAWVERHKWGGHGKRWLSELRSPRHRRGARGHLLE